MSLGIIDEHGMRLNVGIVIVNEKNKLLWGRRIGSRNAWQFPQGGLQVNETLHEAMYRELLEELGLHPNDVAYLAQTKKWLSYRLPTRFQRRDEHPLCIGQKQKWFLLRLLSDDHAIHLDRSSNPEFDQWQWVDYWYPLEHVIEFKREVYRQMLTEFEPLINVNNG